jgi:hypothetical protein
MREGLSGTFLQRPYIEVGLFEAIKPEVKVRPLVTQSLTGQAYVVVSKSQQKQNHLLADFKISVVSHLASYYLYF